MGKLGTFEYPELSVDDAVRYAELLVNEFHKEVKDINEFAVRLGHKSANSGSFFGKLSDMRKFGLVDKKTYRATSRAEIIANPVGNERQNAIKDMILSIPLFEKLNSRLKTKSPTIEQFKTQLIEVTGDREKASKEAEKIRKIYIDAISHIREDQLKEQSNDPFNNMGQELSQQQTNSDLILFRAGKYNLSLPKDDANIDVLISILENMREEKKKKN
ncbi:hypothetical protein AUJ84_03530 [Candidatus Pacearchaeota archaeon CG1_02_32_132]|nr:MAG: hypothetical protein AUJ84_03530 [Candidatus Pacearchaeota archaeon CG1_02_32_132]